MLVGLAVACSRSALTEAPIAQSPGTTSAASPIRLTARAAAKIKEIRHAEGIELPLRIEVRLGGPPPGIEYLLYFDEPRPTDQRFDVDGVSIIVERTSVPHVTGASVDFLETERGAGFKLDNPNEARLRTD